MKKLVLVLMVAFLCGNVPAQAPTKGQGNYLNSVSARMVKLVNAANQDGYKLPDDTFSIGGGWLRQGTDHWVSIFTVALKAGSQYRFIGIGDKDAKDVDIQVVGPERSTAINIKDTSTAPEAIVNWTCNQTGRYLVRLRLYSSVNNLPCCCLGVVLSR